MRTWRIGYPAWRSLSNDVGRCTAHADTVQVGTVRADTVRGTGRHTVVLHAPLTTIARTADGRWLQSQHLPKFRLTSLARDVLQLEGSNHAEEVPCSVQA